MMVSVCVRVADGLGGRWHIYLIRLYPAQPLDLLREFGTVDFLNIERVQQGVGKACSRVAGILCHISVSVHLVNLEGVSGELLESAAQGALYGTLHRGLPIGERAFFVRLNAFFNPPEQCWNGLEEIPGGGAVSHGNELVACGVLVLHVVDSVVQAAHAAQLQHRVKD